MAKAVKKKAAKKRAADYDPKLAINGTFEEVIGISVKGAGTKPKSKNPK